MSEPADDPDATARAVAAAMWADDAASRGLGMELLDVGPGRSRLSMIVRPDMVNGLGVCHGGFIFALADSAMAFASNAHGQQALAQHNAITYIQPGRLGDTLTAIAGERVRAGRSGIYDVRVTGPDGVVIAEMRGQTRTIGKHPNEARTD